MRRAIAVCVLSCSLCPAAGWAQEVNDPQPPATTAALVDPDASASASAPAVRVDAVPTHGFLGPFRRVPRDVVRFGTIETLSVLAVGAAGAATAHRWDHEVRATAVRRLRPVAFRAGNVGGNFYVQTGTALSVLSLATIAGSPRVANLGGDLLRAQVLTQAVVQTSKISTRRARPDGSNHHSLPSGHAAASFATASVLQRHFGWTVGVPAYAFGAYVAAARMSANRHYLSDVLMGASVGIAAGRSVTVGAGRTRFGVGVAPTAGGAVVTFTQQ